MTAIGLITYSTCYKRVSKHITGCYRWFKLTFDLHKEWYVDVVDVSELHIGALLLPEIRSERLFGNAGRYTVNDFLRIFRELYPDRGIGDDIPNVKPDLRKVPNERPAEVLKLLGVQGWVSLEDCVKPLAEQFAAASKASG